MIGQKLNNRYKIISLLGEGGMGEVYLADDEQTLQQVAVKILARQLTAHPDSLERFRREAKTLRQLDHPNIVKFIDAFEHESQYVIVMEYIPGGSLHTLLKKGQLPIERARQIALGLCDALIRSHQLNIIHRDIKPENVLLAEDGTPKLADFGVARLSEGTRMTRSGTQVGTPYYMAPEAWEGKTLDAQADIWSLGALLFEMISGQIPFRGDTPLTVMNRIFTSELPDLKKLRKNVPLDLINIVNRMLKRDKSERYKTMRQVAVDLESGEQVLFQKHDKPTRIVEPKPKIEFSRYRKAIFIAILIMGTVIAIILSARFANRISNPTSQLPIVSTTQLQTVPPPQTVTDTPVQLAVTPTPELSIGSIMTSEKDGMILVFVPAGEFTMGSKSGDEKPIHTVDLNAFWIDKIEVTNQMFSLFISETSYQTDAEKLTPPFISRGFSFGVTQGAFQSGYGVESVEGANWQHPTGQNSDIFGKENFPVINISWNDAKAYCEWAGRRLPTEAEWEKAARGTDGRNYPWGNDEPNSNLANFGHNIGETTITGAYPSSASPYGLYDMAGNVEEWVNDWYQSDYYSTIEDLAVNPQGPSSGNDKVIRGGSWISNSPYISVSQRSELKPTSSSNYIGFRCALTP